MIVVATSAEDGTVGWPEFDADGREVFQPHAERALHEPVLPMVRNSDPGGQHWDQMSVRDGSHVSTAAVSSPSPVKRCPCMPSA